MHTLTKIILVRWFCLGFFNPMFLPSKGGGCISFPPLVVLYMHLIIRAATLRQKVCGDNKDPGCFQQHRSPLCNYRPRKQDVQAPRFIYTILYATNLPVGITPCTTVFVGLLQPVLDKQEQLPALC